MNQQVTARGEVARLEEQLAAAETPGAPGSEAAAAIRADLAAAKARVAALEAEMRPLRDQIVAGVAADRELAAAIARRKEASFGAPPPEDGKPAPTYADLERLAHGIEHDLERLRALADADAASTAAKEEHALADETGRIGELQAQIASFQAELDALEGPIIEMLDPHGMPVPAPPQG